MNSAAEVAYAIFIDHKIRKSRENLNTVGIISTILRQLTLCTHIGKGYVTTIKTQTRNHLNATEHHLPY